MTALTLGEAAAMALGGVRARGARSPVRRDSAEEGSFEAMFFVAPAKGECDRLLRAARAALDAGRRVKRTARAEARDLTPPERALAGVSTAAVRVYEELLTLARLNRGHVYPGYDRLAAATALGRATVARALAALEAAGFLIRRRRYRRVEGEGAGPRYAQCSNAYRPTWPAALAGMLPQSARPAPLPPCEESRAAADAAETAAMRSTLGCRELAATMVGGALGRVLARLGARIDARDLPERESHDGPGTLDESINRRTSSADPRDRPSRRRTIPLPDTTSQRADIIRDAPATPMRCFPGGTRNPSLTHAVEHTTRRWVEPLPSRPVVF